jgi:hypothetical protein
MGNLTKCAEHDLIWPLQPKSVGLPASQCGGTKFRMKIRMGRTKPGNWFQGHFQGQARQLTSSAIGRAILESVFKFTHDKNVRRCRVYAMTALVKNYAGHHLHRNRRRVFFGLCALRAWLRKTLI